MLQESAAPILFSCPLFCFFFVVICLVKNSSCGWFLLKREEIYIGFNGAKTNCIHFRMAFYWRSVITVKYCSSISCWQTVPDQLFLKANDHLFGKDVGKSNNKFSLLLDFSQNYCNCKVKACMKLFSLPCNYSHG